MNESNFWTINHHSQIIKMLRLQAILLISSTIMACPPSSWGSGFPLYFVHASIPHAAGGGGFCGVEVDSLYLHFNERQLTVPLNILLWQQTNMQQ